MAEPIRDKVSAEDLQALLADDKREWLEAIDAIHAEFGEAGVREILRSVHRRILSAANGRRSSAHKDMI